MGVETSVLVGKEERGAVRGRVYVYTSGLQEKSIL